MKKYQGIEYADKIAKEFAQKAKDKLSHFPDSTSKVALATLVDYIVDRQK